MFGVHQKWEFLINTWYNPGMRSSYDSSDPWKIQIIKIDYRKAIKILKKTNNLN